MTFSSFSSFLSAHLSGSARVGLALGALSLFSSAASAQEARLKSLEARVSQQERAVALLQNESEVLAQNVYSVLECASLDGMILSLVADRAQVFSSGSSGVHFYAMSRMQRYEEWPWRDEKLRPEERWGSPIEFGKDKWRSDNEEGTYTMQRVGESRLYLELEGEECGMIVLLLDFNSSSSGAAVSIVEHKLIKQPFTLNPKAAPEPELGDNVPESFHEAIFNIDNHVVYVKGEKAYYARPELPLRYHEVKPEMKAGAKAGEFVDQLGTRWRLCEEFLYEGLGHEALLRVLVDGPQGFELGGAIYRSSKEGGYVIADVPAIVELRSGAGNGYSGDVTGYAGASEAAGGAPRALSEIHITDYAPNKPAEATDADAAE